uniref:Uncharacterized protein n=1 Tax=Bionectria ochroleuca TaxID=29856 RepID=A0A8H7TW28_BIOOC
MDYSSSIHETDDPAASPWGPPPPTSPGKDASGFGPLAGDASSPFFPQSSSAGLSQDPSAPEGFQRPGTATTASETEAEPDSLEAPVTSQDAAPTQTQREPLQNAPPPAGGAGNNINQQPATQGAQPAQDGQAQQPQKPAQPQHRLQAKITGLERTGKKDPVLRFDVYVSGLTLLVGVRAWACRPLLTLNIPDKPAKIPHYAVSRCSTSSLRVRQTRRSPDIFLPGVICPSSPTGRHVRRGRHG